MAPNNNIWAWVVLLTNDCCLLQTHVGRARSKSASRRTTLKRKYDDTSMVATATRSRSASRATSRDKSGLRDETVGVFGFMG